MKLPINNRLKNANGVVVILVLWVLVILTALAVSLGKNAHIEMSLTKYALGRMKSKYAAWAGISCAQNQIALDSQDTSSNQEDTYYYCGVARNNNADLNKLFEKVRIGDEEFSLSFQQEEGDSVKKHYGFTDEERRINLNALTSQNADVFAELLKLLDVDEETSKTIAYSVADWIDSDSVVSSDLKEQRPYGAENDYYESLSNGYRAKNLPIQSVEELLLVKGMTEEIYSKIQPYITLYPSSATDGLKINFNTASRKVLQAVAATSASNSGQADQIVDKLISYRNGDDGKAYTPDDRSIVPNESLQSELSLSASEQLILNNIMSSYHRYVSNYFRIVATGKDESGISTTIEAVVSRQNNKIIAWHRD